MCSQAPSYQKRANSTMSTPKLVTLSGVHGVGKTTVVSLVRRMQDFKVGPERPLNPFQSSYEAMLFFIASFAWRDEQASQFVEPTLLDRWAFVDIKIYIQTLELLGHINNNQCLALQEVLKHSFSGRVKPDVAILLDDSSANILYRLEHFRQPSKYRIFERDLSFISALRERFLSTFRLLESKETGKVRVHVFNVNKCSPDQIAEKVLNLVNA